MISCFLSQAHNYRSHLRNADGSRVGRALLLETFVTRSIGAGFLRIVATAPANNIYGTFRPNIGDYNEEITDDPIQSAADTCMTAGSLTTNREADTRPSYATVSEQQGESRDSEQAYLAINDTEGI